MMVRWMVRWPPGAWFSGLMMLVAMMVGDFEPIHAQTKTATVATSTVGRAASPPPARRLRRKSRRPVRRRRRRPPVSKVQPPTGDDRLVFLEPDPKPIVEVGSAPQARGGASPKSESSDSTTGALSRVWSRAWREGLGAWRDALWAVLWVIGLALFTVRVTAVLVRRAAERGLRVARLVDRNWRLIEGLAWIGVGLWVVDRLASGTGMGAVAVATGGMVLVVILASNAIRDVISGLLLNLERPFEVGDYVRVAEAEGQVRAFRTRVVELVAPDGHRLFVPYRALAGTTDVRPGGRSAAHSVKVVLRLPDGFDPADALALAEEIARASPWATLASEPRIAFEGAPGRELTVEAFAFHPEAQSLLHADLVRSWNAVCRRKP